MMNEARSKTRAALNTARSVVITTHQNPDGDAMGSVLALRLILQQQGRRVTVVLPTPAPSNLQWMPGADQCTVWTGSETDLQVLQAADTVVVADLNTLGRLGSLGEAIRTVHATVVNIDHHTHPENFAAVAWIETEAPAVCSMIAELYEDVHLSAEAAMCLYCGLMTDTGSFRFPRTTSHVFDQAARLVRQGADPVAAYERIMNTNAFARERLLGAALQSLRLEHDGRLCVMTVSLDDLARTGTIVDDTEGFVHHTLSIAGVQMGVLCVQLPDQIKCSFRSKGNVFIRNLAASYGGGGHVYAAGARIAGSDLQATVERIVADAATVLSSATP